jgi:hypothetical protein
MHREIPVKVNAWVDEGIAPLVVALNEHERIWTLDSCQSDEALGAYVMFAFEGAAGQVDQFASGLARGFEGSSFYRLEIDQQAGEDDPVLTLSCPPDRVRELARAVSAARTKP